MFLIVSSDSDCGFLGVDDSWSGRKRKSIEELTEPLREELQEAFNQLGLEKEYCDGRLIWVVVSCLFSWLLCVETHLGHDGLDSNKMFKSV